MTGPLYTGSPASIDYVAQQIGDLNQPTAVYAPNAQAETIPAQLATTAFTPTSGNLYVWAVHLGKGETISNVGFVTSTTAGATLNHWWTCVVDQTYTVQASSTDQTSGAIAASTWITLPMAKPFVTAYAGLYLLGVMISNNAGTQPTLCGSAAGPLVAMLTGTGAPTPKLGGQSNTSATTALAVGTAITAPTATAAVPYLYCS